MRWFGILPLACCLLGPPVTFAQDDADALAQRFLAHMKANVPVAGEFEIYRESDAESYKRRQESAAQMKFEGRGAVKVTVPPRTGLGRYRWAWDGVREMTEALTDGKSDRKDVILSFFNSPEGQLITRNAAGYYRLAEAGKVSDYRPGSFYSLYGGGIPWPEFLKDMSFSTTPAEGASPVGTVWLIARNDGLELRLLVERETGVMHRMVGYWESDKYVEVTIDAFERGKDHRLFPRRARIEVFAPDSPGRPSHTETLNAKRIDFPSPGEETHRALTLILPKGATVFDRVLNRQIVLSADTPARTVVERGDFGTSRTVPIPETSEPLAHYVPPARWRWWWVGAGAALALAAAVAVVAVRRRYRA